VSFSIGVLNGWEKSETGRPQIDELLTLDDALVCSFCPARASDNLMFQKLDHARMMVWRSSRNTTAKQEAKRFAASIVSGVYRQEVVSPITTKAGDHGYLLVMRVNFEKGSALVSDFFFHAGAKGALRISIRTPAADAQLFEQLQNLLLQTLRFTDDGVSRETM
jgi:hypothetical protein